MSFLKKSPLKLNNIPSGVFKFLISKFVPEKYIYYELLWAVEKKYPNETRHETALRYIKGAERRIEGQCNEGQCN